MNEILAFINIISNNIERHGYEPSYFVIRDIMKKITELIELDVRSYSGQTLLHLCLDYTTDLREILEADFCM